MAGIFRVVKYGAQYFWRHAWLSFATIIIMVLALLMYQGLMIFDYVTSEALTSLQSKIDIAVYFKINAEEEDMLKIQEAVEALPEVAETEYISRDEALARFKERHVDDVTLTQALEELQTNPLLASVNIQAHDPEQYPTIASYLENPEFEPFIERVTFTQNRLAIERLTRIIDTADRFGFGIAIFISIAAALVIFNTIRLAIYSSREEISIMRLVGGSNYFIKGPYLVNGVFYGLAGALMALLISAPVVNFMAPYFDRFIEGLSLEQYFYNNLFSFFLILIAFGVGLGLVSSWIAIRRYLTT
ncbi:MAG: permease-like cell division protein FtsX [Candidatus Harrisonbacteria bacterium]|nr:permease-like cell division protein FtsX [Candidatus Harrisonbacteria bacterium]